MRTERPVDPLSDELLSKEAWEKTDGNQRADFTLGRIPLVKSWIESQIEKADDHDKPALELYLALAEDVTRLFASQVALMGQLTTDSPFQPWRKTNSDTCEGITEVITEWTSNGQLADGYVDWLRCLQKAVDATTSTALEDAVEESKVISKRFEDDPTHPLIPVLFISDYNTLGDAKEGSSITVGEIEMYLFKIVACEGLDSIREDVVAYRARQLPKEWPWLVSELVVESVAAIGEPAMSHMYGIIEDDRSGMMVCLNTNNTLTPTRRLFNQLGFPTDKADQLVHEIIFRHERGHLTAPNTDENARVFEWVTDLLLIMRMLQLSSNLEQTIHALALAYIVSMPQKETPSEMEEGYRVSALAFLTALRETLVWDETRGQPRLDLQKADVAIARSVGQYNQYYVEGKLPDPEIMAIPFQSELIQWYLQFRGEPVVAA